MIAIIRHPRQAACLAWVCVALNACSALPPGHDYPRLESYAITHPEQTELGAELEQISLAHPGKSGFYLQSFGADGYLTRMQMINVAEKTLDLQYFILRGDDTGRLLTDAALRAADRGVRVRILIDDGETLKGDEQIAPLASHRAVEIRVFNPFRYRGHSFTIRGAEYLFNKSRLNYRMHNKLLVVDNSAALLGGRNLGDKYFQINAEEQYADNDVFAVGPIVERLSASFDEFWNHPLSIPYEALESADTSHAALRERRDLTTNDPAEVEADGIDWPGRVASGKPFNQLMSGELPLVWAPARLISDSPDKKRTQDGSRRGRLMLGPLNEATLATQSQLLMVTPYLIPGEEGMALFSELLGRGVKVRILTNSQISSTVVLAHSGYVGFRVPLLEAGVELYEIRAQLGNVRGSGQTVAMSRNGTYSLHAKMFVFDQHSIFVGSLNFDPRSMYLNTEIGILIESAVLARELTRRFEAMVQPANAYQVMLRSGLGGRGRNLVWRTLEGDEMVELEDEPSRGIWQSIQVNILSLFPLDSDL